MKAGDLVLARLAQADAEGKVRPVLLLCQIPPFGDWLVCGISSQLRRFQENFDELIQPNAPDFSISGLKSASVIRLGFLGTLAATQIGGSFGSIDPSRLLRLRRALARHLNEAP